MSKRQPEPCAQWAEQLAQASFGHLSAPEDAALRAHLAVCPACVASRADYLQTAALLRQASDPDPLPGLPPQLLQAWAAEGRRASARQTRAGHLQEVFMQTIHEHTPPSLPPKPPTWRQRLGHRTTAALSAVAAVLVIALIITGIFASRGLLPRGTNPAHPGFLTATPPSSPAALYVPNGNDILQAVQMLSPGEGWAVGDTDKFSHNVNTFSCLVLHYSQGQWKRVVTPTNAELGLQDADLQSIAMVSPDEGWAVGLGDNAGSTSAAGLFLPDTSLSSDTSPYSGPGGPLPIGLILHYSAGKWTRFSTLPDAELWSVQFLSPTDGWAVGGGGWGTGQGATTSILLHYNGSQWTEAQAPNVAGITSLDMLSATDGWATGTDTILHYNGQQWSVFQRLPGIAGLSMDSATDGWAFGYVNFPENHPSSYNEVWHFNGSQWVGGTLPSTVNADAEIQGLSMDSASDGWAVGFGNGGKGQSRYALYLHYSNGQWTQVQGPGPTTSTPPSCSRRMRAGQLALEAR